LWAKKYVDVISFVSKSKKVIKAYYQRFKLLRKEKLNEEKGTYISQVSIHAF
jgi:hypothetical protein